MMENTELPHMSVEFYIGKGMEIMKNVSKRSLSLLLVLTLLVGLLTGLAVNTTAASYVYNWGTRGTVATQPSQYADAFYTGTNTFDNFMTLAGSSSTSSVPDSALYKALQSFMSSKQTYVTSYDATKNLYQYTDCQNGGGKISSFYTGKEIGPDWNGGWNREHTWPNSKGEGSAENDIMMLRPTTTSENSSRGNTAYGEGTSFYDPNKESGGKYNLHGDVARIMLYVYCRWGNTGKMWGSSGVMESRDVLLKWVEEDPVDTWELGRNDAVQSITGTRNVFVDYPELIFQLFDEPVPAGYATPSSGGEGTLGAAATLTFSENGENTMTETTFEGASFTVPSPQKAAADDWAFLGWVDSAVSKTNLKPGDIYAPGAKYKVPKNGGTLYALYTMFDGDGQANTYTLADAPANGDQVVIYNAGSGYAVAAKLKGDYYLDYVDVNPDGDQIITTEPTVLWTVTKNSDGTYSFANGENVLSLNWNTSNSKTSITLDGLNPKLTLETCSAADKSYYVYSATQKGSYEHIYLEWYAKYLDFSAYDTGTEKLSASAFGFQFYTATGASWYATTTEKATTYKVTFKVDETTAAVPSMTADALGIVLPAAASPADSNFVGWVTAPVAETKEAPEVIYTAGTRFVPKANTVLYALYSVGEGGIELVDDVSTLKAGDQFLLANYTAGTVAGPEATNNNGNIWLTSLNATFASDAMSILSYPDEAYIFTLGGEEGAWTLSTDKGTLAVTKAENGNLSWTGENNTWTIAIEDTGDATIINTWAEGRPEELRYNKTSGQERFTNYDSVNSKLPTPQLYRVSGGLTFMTGKIAEPEYTLGDVNEDLTVNILDVMAIINIITGAYQPTDSQYAAADMDLNGTVNIMDAMQLINQITGA